MSASSSLKADGAADARTQPPMKRKILMAIILPVWVLAAFLFAQLVISGILSGVSAVGVSFAGINGAVLNATIGSLIYVLSIVLVIGLPWLVLKSRTTAKEVGLHRLPSWLDIGITPLGFLAYLLLSALLLAFAQQFLTFIDFDQPQATGFDQISLQYEYILAFITLVVVAPIAEEVLFRGYLLGKLRKYTATWLAVLITSLLFALVHFAWNVGIDVFALSIVLCLVTIWSKSLWPAILLHMLKNFVAFYFLFINPTLLTTLGG